MAVAELKKGVDVDSYMSAIEWLSKVAPHDPAARIDTDWAADTSRKVKFDTDRLEHELKTYKNNLIKESIRMGQEDLGNHYFATGDYANAFKAYGKMREFCTSPKQIAQMTFKLLYVTVAQRNWVIAASYQPKIAALQIPQDEKAKFDPILYACAGLASLSQGNYRDAAQQGGFQPQQGQQGQNGGSYTWGPEPMQPAPTKGPYDAVDAVPVNGNCVQKYGIWQC
jgi:COP9 signalosome complex subunit 1